jgi:hypothetical protein
LSGLAVNDGRSRSVTDTPGHYAGHYGTAARGAVTPGGGGWSDLIPLLPGARVVSNWWGFPAEWCPAHSARKTRPI